MKNLLLPGVLIFFYLTSAAQNATDVMRYASDPFYGDAHALSTSGAFTMFYGSIAGGTLNPASLALTNRTEFSISSGIHQTNNQLTFFSPSFSGTTQRQGFSVPDVSFLLRFPTTQGSLVMGWSIAQANDFGRKSSANVFNDNSSITDQLSEDPFYYATAWDGFAFDSVGGRAVPVLRLGTFQGIDQQYELIETGSAHDLNLFWATEFKENVFLGGSLTIPFGIYSYTRNFIETDPDNKYNSRTIGNDVRDIVAQDKIDARFQSAYFRVGMVVRPLEFLYFSAALRTATRVVVAEDYSTTIQTRFDNGDEYLGELSGEVKYDVRSPARMLLGGGIDLGKLRAGVTAQWTDFTKSSIRFNASVFDRDLAETERLINQEIASDFRRTARLNLGIEWDATPDFSIRASTGFIPETTSSLNRDMQLFAGGATLRLGKLTQLDAGVRYTTFKDANAVYVSQAGNLTSSDNVTTMHGFATLRFYWRTDR